MKRMNYSRALCLMIFCGMNFSAYGIFGRLKNLKNLNKSLYKPSMRFSTMPNQLCLSDIDKNFRSCFDPRVNKDVQKYAQQKLEERLAFLLVSFQTYPKHLTNALDVMCEKLAQNPWAFHDHFIHFVAIQSPMAALRLIKSLHAGSRFQVFAYLVEQFFRKVQLEGVNHNNMVKFLVQWLKDTENIQL